MLMLALLLLMSSPAGAEILSPDARSRHERGATAKSDHGDISIALREMYVDITDREGKPRKGALLIIFDQWSGRYVYEFGPVRMDEQKLTISSGYGTTGVAYVAPDRIIVFAFGPPSLIVHESFAKASRMDEAELGALSDATGRLEAKLKGRTDDRVLVDLSKLPRGFFLSCNACSGPGPQRVVSIERKGATWEIVLQGQWPEKVTLDEKYQLKSNVRLN